MNYVTEGFSRGFSSYSYGCGLEFVELFDTAGALRKDLGQSLIQKIVS